MYNYKDILAALQSGEDAESVAQDFTAALNRAIAEKRIADQAEADARAKAKAKAETYQEKVEWADEILHMFFDFIKAFYPDAYDEETAKSITAEKFVKETDALYEQLKDLSSSLKELSQSLK